MLKFWQIWCQILIMEPKRSQMCQNVSDQSQNAQSASTFLEFHQSLGALGNWSNTACELTPLFHNSPHIHRTVWRRLKLKSDSDESSSAPNLVWALIWRNPQTLGQDSNPGFWWDSPGLSRAWKGLCHLWKETQWRWNIVSEFLCLFDQLKRYWRF